MTDTFDQLVNDARVKRVSPMLATTDGPLTAEERARGMKEIEKFLCDQDLTRGDLATGIRRGNRAWSQSTVSMLFSNDPRLNVQTRDQMIRAALAWIEMEYRAIHARAQRPDAFHLTRVAERLFAAARRLTERPDMAVAWGPAGIGKTTTIKAIQAELPNVIVVTIRPDTRCAYAFLRQLYGALQRRRRHPKSRVSIEQIMDLLGQSSRVASRPLLIVDQAHELHERVLKVLMTLHDECGLSVLLVGTVDAHKSISDDDDMQYGQLSSRVGLRLDLCPELFAANPGGSAQRRQLFSVKEIRAIFHRGEVKLHPEAADLLCRIANTSIGHLRRVDRLVVWAAAVAQKDGRPVVTVEDLRQASRIVEGPEQSARLPFAPPPSAPTESPVQEATA